MAMAKAEQPIDLEHLDRYTGGDRAINEEILGLFADQCRNSLARLSQLTAKDIGTAAWDMKSWGEIVHTLKGAARGVGAFALGDSAAEAEKAGWDRQAASAALELMQPEVAAVQRFIEKQLKSGT